MIAMQPYDDQGKPRKDFDKDMFFDAAKLLRDCAGMVAQYESPKLSAIAIAPPARKEVTRMTIRIFDDKGNKVAPLLCTGPLFRRLCEAADIGEQPRYKVAASSTSFSLHN